MLARLTNVIARRRWYVIGVWLALTIFGGYSAGQVSKRWFQSFSIPGYSAYEANQRMLKQFGTGQRNPNVVVFHTNGDATKSDAIRAAMERAAKANPGARTSSYFSTGSLAYVSKDRHTAFEEIYPVGVVKFDTKSGATQTLNAAAAGLPPEVTVHVTGHDPIAEASSKGQTGGPSVLLEGVIGGIGALIILFFVFGTLPAIAMPLVVALASILNTFSLVWALTYVTNVSIIVQFLIALVGLGVAIDYALLMIFRFRDELREGEDVETALVETMTHAGRSVIVSGSTVAVGLLSMVILPLPFIRSIGLGGMLIPAVSVLASITLLPVLLLKLGHRIDSLRVIPKRIVSADPGEAGFWHKWAEIVVRRPVAVVAAGLVIVALLLIPASSLNPSEAQAKNLPGKGDAFAGRDALTAAGISAGVMKPFVVVVEHGAKPQTLKSLVSRLEQTPGIVGAAAPPAWRKGDTALVEAFAKTDASAKPARKTISSLQHDVLPAAAASAEGDTTMTLGGAAPE